jgi:flagellar protein FliO/FliZ
MLSEVSTSIQSSTANSSGGIYSLIWIGVLTLILIIFMFLYFFLLKTIKNKKNNSGIFFIKKFFVDRNIYVGILKIFDEYYLILFTNSSSEIIKKLSYEEVNDIAGDKKNFMNYFGHFLNKEKKSNEE